jgi:hypothetical protein
MKIRIFDAGTREHLTGGYPLHARETIKHLKAIGHEVVLYPDDGKGEDIVLWIRPPHYIKYPEFNHKKINVFFTMHELETFTGYKKEWPSLLNKCDAIITPTKWNKKVWEKHGVKAPIYVVPLGVNPKEYHGAKTFHFSILTVHEGLGLKGSRELWKDTLSAYYDAFYDNHNEEVILNIKSWSVNYANYHDYLAELREGKDMSKCPPVNVIDLELETSDMNRLYAKHWLFLKNAFREGWCLPLWEALAAGTKIAYANLPVYENLVGLKGTRTFRLGDIEDLRDIMLDGFREWKREKGFITKFSWRNTVIETAKVLETAYKNAPNYKKT